MRQIFRMSSALATVLACGIFAPGSANAFSTIAQGPCAYDSNGRCLIFNYATAVIPVIRSFSFNMTTPGDALINFQGDIHCENASNAHPSVIDLVGQIVTNSTLTPNYQGPGGAHLAMVLPTADGTFNLTYSNTANFSATRRIHYTSAGTKSVYFKVANARMDFATYCYVLTAAFNAVVTP